MRAILPRVVICHLSLPYKLDSDLKESRRIINSGFKLTRTPKPKCVNYREATLKIKVNI